MIWGPGVFDVGLVGGLVTWAWACWWLARFLARPTRDVAPEWGERGLVNWFWLGIGTQVVIIVIWYMAAGGYELNASVWDSEAYDALGWELAQDFRQAEFHLVSVPAYLEDQYLGFFYWVAAIYGLFGHHHILVSLWNCILSAWTAVLVYSISVALFDSRVAKYSFLLVLFYPQSISASYFLLKDVLVSFLATLTIWAVYVPKELRFKTSVFFGALLLLSQLRAPLAVILGALGVVQLILLVETAGRRKMVALFAGACVAGFALTGGSVINVGQTTTVPYATPGEQEEAGLTEGIRLTLSLESAREVGLVVLTSPLRTSMQAIYTLLRVFYGPFFLYAREGPNLRPYDPNETGFRAVLESLSGIMTGLLVPMILIGFYACMKKRAKAIFLLYSWVLIGCIMLVFVGVITRWRLPLVPVILLLAGRGFAGWTRKLELYPLYFIAYVLLFAVNATMPEGMFLGGVGGVAIAVCLAWALMARRRNWLVRRTRDESQ